MRVVLLTQYFPPETGGPQNRLASMAEGLSEHGHAVTVLTAKPSYPTGVVFEGFEDAWCLETEYAGIPVIHSWVLPDEEKTRFRRILFYVSFMVSSVLASLRLDGDVDVVVASSPPLLVGLSGWVVSRLEDARFVFDVRDLWPDVAIAMGELSGGWMAQAAKIVEGFIYRKADGITAATSGFCRDIQERASADTPVVRISNGTVPETFELNRSKADLRSRLQLPPGFLVTYAGTVGLAQTLDHLVEAAEKIEDVDPEVNLLVLGNGPRRAKLERIAAAHKLNNLQFRDRVPLERAAQYMAASDALLVPLGDRPIYRKFIPSKLFDAMAAGRPVLLSVDGEAREILEAADAGLYYPPEDADGLVDAIERLKSDPESEQMGRRGREYVTQHFTRSEQARRMAQFLEKIVYTEEE